MRHPSLIILTGLFCLLLAGCKAVSAIDQVIIAPRYALCKRNSNDYVISHKYTSGMSEIFVGTSVTELAVTDTVIVGKVERATGVPVIGAPNISGYFILLLNPNRNESALKDGLDEVSWKAELAKMGMVTPPKLKSSELKNWRFSSL